MVLRLWRIISMSLVRLQGSQMVFCGSQHRRLSSGIALRKKNECHQASFIYSCFNIKHRFWLIFSHDHPYYLLMKTSISELKVKVPIYFPFEAYFQTKSSGRKPDIIKVQKQYPKERNPICHSRLPVKRRTDMVLCTTARDK